MWCVQHWLGGGLYIEYGVCSTGWEKFALNMVCAALVGKSLH